MAVEVLHGLVPCRQRMGRMVSVDIKAEHQLVTQVLLTHKPEAAAAVRVKMARMQVELPEVTKVETVA